MGEIAINSFDGTRIAFAQDIHNGNDVMASLRRVAEKVTQYTDLYPYMLLSVGTKRFSMKPSAYKRFAQAVQSSRDVSLFYADYADSDGDKITPHPLIDYQNGSIRDDFDFGPVWFVSVDRFCEAVSKMTGDYRYASLYDLRLRLSEMGPITHIPESLATVERTDRRKSGERQFDYVNPHQREVQVEMERACTEHLRRIGAWLSPEREVERLDEGSFPVEASVIIPVRNRERTIADAVRSALSQRADFDFNVLVVDNHSTDGTTDILRRMAVENKRLVHIIPERQDLCIGGCWNLAVNDARCGRFCIQLDSDDLYADANAVAHIVSAFRRTGAAAVVGSYRMVDFALNELPPGVIDHREWTDENGANNALRINGFGAPRAFFTPVIREIGFSDTNYGEDYAAMLAVSRTHRVTRIFEPIYLCRRWEGNSDAALSIARENANNAYKDWIRTMEIGVRGQGVAVGCNLKSKV